MIRKNAKKSNIGDGQLQICTNMLLHATDYGAKIQTLAYSTPTDITDLTLTLDKY